MSNRRTFFYGSFHEKLRRRDVGHDRHDMRFCHQCDPGLHPRMGADSAAAVGRSDYDLVELRCSENHYGSGGHCAVCFYKNAERA